jgi:hypothetical protein
VHRAKTETKLWADLLKTQEVVDRGRKGDEMKMLLLFSHVLKSKAAMDLRMAGLLGTDKASGKNVAFPAATLRH